MQIISPYQYLIDLKKILLHEKEKIVRQKELFLHSNNYEAAATCRSIENELNQFIENLISIK